MTTQFNPFDLTTWTLEQPFRFESSGSLQDVVHSLAGLEEQAGFFSAARNEMSILPLNDGYTFRYRIRRRSKRNSSHVTAYGEGQVWEDPSGGVVVEGVAQVDPWNLYGPVIASVVIAFALGIAWRGFGGLIPILLLGIGAYSIFSAYQDRNRVVENIAEAVNSTLSVSDQFRRAKDKRTPTSEKVKNTRLNVDEVARPGSVWNEAISEYEDDEQGYEQR